MCNTNEECKYNHPDCGVTHVPDPYGHGVSTWLCESCNDDAADALLQYQQDEPSSMYPKNPRDL